MSQKVSRMFIVFCVLAVFLSACQPPVGVPDSQSQAQQQAQQNQAQRSFYIPKNDLEFKNYNARQELADDPTTILWCTFFPFTGGQEPFTVPVIGKLTSSGKRPFQTQKLEYGGDFSQSYYPEQVQPDGMYGSSVEYRYGFSPDGTYVDFTDLPSFCTNKPTVWQANKTTIIVEGATDLQAINDAAQEALKNGDAAGAMELLNQADNSGDE